MRTMTIMHGNNTLIRIGDIKGYLITGERDGQLAYVSLKMTKQGSTMSGIVENLCATINLALDSRVLGLVEILEPMIDMVYEPNGFTNDPDIPECSSISDWMAKRLALDYLDEEDWVRLGM